MRRIISAAVTMGSGKSNGAIQVRMGVEKPVLLLAYQRMTPVMAPRIKSLVPARLPRLVAWWLNIPSCSGLRELSLPVSVS